MLTVNEPRVLAPLLRWEGRVAPSSLSFAVMWYFEFRSWNCLLSFAQFSKSWTYPGHLSVARPGALNQAHGGVERQRQEDCRGHPLQRRPGVEQRDRQQHCDAAPEQRHQHDLGDRSRLNLVRAHRA
jgi:hypothetical protein